MGGKYRFTKNWYNKITMTTDQITSLVRIKLLENSTEIVADATLLIYANLAYKDVIKRAFPNNSVTSATVNFTSGVGSLPAGFGTLYTDVVDSQGNIYPEVSISDFVRKLQNGENAVCVEEGELKISPVSVASASIKYYPTYTALSSGSTPSIDEYLHEPIVYGTLSRAFEDLQDFELSKYFGEKYETMLTDKLAHLSNYEEDAQRGNVMFNGIQLISNNGGGFSNDPNRI